MMGRGRNSLFLFHCIFCVFPVLLKRNVWLQLNMNGKKKYIPSFGELLCSRGGAVNNHIILENKKSPDGVVPTRTFVAILLSGDA